MRNLIQALCAMAQSDSTRTDGSMQPARWRKRRLTQYLLLPVLLPALGATAGNAQNEGKPIAEFTNVSDSRTGFAIFGSMPAISDTGAVAFEASGANFGQGVFRWHDGRIETIASRTGSGLSNFGDDVVINCANVVAFDANLPVTNDRAILTSDGATLKTIADSTQQHLLGSAFFGLGAMNCSGTVAFSAIRPGFKSQAIFEGSGGLLAVLDDTLTSDFTAFGEVAINASGDVAFRALRSDGSVGIFAGPDGSVDIANNNNPAFSDFLDPVINREGVVASAAFLSNGGVEVFTGTGGSISARTDPQAR